MTGLLYLLFSSTAHALCDGSVYTAQAIVADMQLMTEGILSKDKSKIMYVGTKMEKSLLCMRSPAPPKVFATLYRGLGVYYHTVENPKEGNRYFRTSLELEPSFSWGTEEFLQSDPIHQAFEQQRVIASVEEEFVPHRIFSIPENTALYLDGRPLRWPTATPERPHVLLLVDANTKEVQGRYLLNGNEFREELLVEGEPDLQVYDESEVEEMFVVKKVTRMKPPAKIPLVVAGGTFALISGGMYGYTFKLNQEFQNSINTQEMKDIQSKNNSLVIASGAMIGLGLGLGYTGVLIDGQGLGLPPIGGYLLH